jgi:hypothetical protein
MDTLPLSVGEDVPFLECVNILQEFCENDVLHIYRWVGMYNSNKHWLITLAKHFAFHRFHNEEDGLFLDENAEEESIMCFGIFIARVFLSLITIPLKMSPRFWEKSSLLG